MAVASGPLKVQKYLAALSVVLFLAKMLAWALTHSVTILTDALEGIVNMVAGFLGLYSLWLAARPRDTNHPYGHGKVELLAAAVEGTLIIIAGLVIFYEGVTNLFVPHQLHHLNWGLFIVAAAGLINYFVGRYAIAQGRRQQSLVLESAGSHLLTDAYSSIAVIIGVSLLLLTHNRWMWLDSVVGIFFAAITVITGYKVLRRCISGMMDEMDMTLLNKVINVMQQNRQPQWIDLHNLRVTQHGSQMHIDAHLTLPWYQQVVDADRELHAVEDLIKGHFDTGVEFFIHIDGCMPYQCRLCALPQCPQRQEPYQAQVQWNVDNVWADAKHGKDS